MWGRNWTVAVTNLVEVNVHTLELELRGTVVDTIAVEAVLARDGLPESSTDLVTLRGENTISITAHAYRQNKQEGELLTH